MVFISSPLTARFSSSHMHKLPYVLSIAVVMWRGLLRLPFIVHFILSPRSEFLSKEEKRDANQFGRLKFFDGSREQAICCLREAKAIIFPRRTLPVCRAFSRISIGKFAGLPHTLHFPSEFTGRLGYGLEDLSRSTLQMDTAPRRFL